MAYRPQVVVSKNSGTTGGSDTKISAAIELGLFVVVIDRPAIVYPQVVYTKKEVLARI